jgi:hypothetical protein
MITIFLTTVSVALLSPAANATVTFDQCREAINQVVERDFGKYEVLNGYWAKNVSPDGTLSSNNPVFASATSASRTNSGYEITDIGYTCSPENAHVSIVKKPPYTTGGGAWLRAPGFSAQTSIRYAVQDMTKRMRQSGIKVVMYDRIDLNFNSDDDSYPTWTSTLIREGLFGTKSETWCLDDTQNWNDAKDLFRCGRY